MNFSNSHLPTSMAVVFIFLFLLILPFDHLLTASHLDDFKSHHLGDILKNLVIILFGYGLIKRFGYTKIAGLSQWLPNHPILLIIGLYFVVLGPLEYLLLGYQFDHIKTVDVLVLLAAMLSVGLSEEIIFRGFVLPHLLTGAPAHQSVLQPIFLASLLFGLLHFLNLFQVNAYLPLVLAQVIYATMFGVAFGIILLRTGSILPLGLLHGVINFSSNWDELPGAIAPAGLELYRLPEAIISVLVVLPFLLYMLREVRKVDRETLT